MPTLFMIHGMFSTAEDWEHYLPFFEARGYRCVATTLPYHDIDPRGTPDPHLGTMSLLDYADALEREIKALGEKPIIMGHSMGGLLAQMLAARGLAEKVVLLAPASPWGILALTPSVIRSFWSIQNTWAFWKKPVRQTYAEAIYSCMHLLPPEEQRESYDRYIYGSGRAVAEIGCWFFDPHRAAKVDEAKVTCPMLIVFGTQDRITPRSAVRQVVKKYRHVATLKEFPDHAHLLMQEPGWQNVAAYVADWLTSPAPPPQS